MKTLIALFFYLPLVSFAQKIEFPRDTLISKMDEKFENDNRAPVATNDCSKYSHTVEDKMTGDKTKQGKKTIIVSTDGYKTGFQIFLFLSNHGSIAVGINTKGGAGCIDKGSKVNILFTDGSRLETASDTDFNCSGECSIYFGEVFGKEDQLKELQTKLIATMRVWTMNGFVQKDFTSENSYDFFNTINCLSK